MNVIHYLCVFVEHFYELTNVKRRKNNKYVHVYIHICVNVIV